MGAVVEVNERVWPKALKALVAWRLRSIVNNCAQRQADGRRWERTVYIQKGAAKSMQQDTMFWIQLGGNGCRQNCMSFG